MEDDKIANTTDYLLSRLFEALLKQLQGVKLDTTRPTSRGKKRKAVPENGAYAVFGRMRAIIGESVLLDAVQLAITDSVKRFEECLESEAEPIIEDDNSPSLFGADDAGEALNSEEDLGALWLQALNGRRRKTRKRLAIYEVCENPRSSLRFTLYSNVKWCPCLFYETEVLTNQRRWSCRHWVAMKLAEVLGTATVQRRSARRIREMALDSLDRGHLIAQ
ncbi:unnamed protein product, partial [Mesorhabditis spiculigera]